MLNKKKKKMSQLQQDVNNRDLNNLHSKNYKIVIFYKNQKKLSTIEKKIFIRLAKIKIYLLGNTNRSTPKQGKSNALIN